MYTYTQSVSSALMALVNSVKIDETQKARIANISSLNPTFSQNVIQFSSNHEVIKMIKKCSTAYVASHEDQSVHALNRILRYSVHRITN